MKTRKQYWKKYYEVKVKPDKEKMAIRSERASRQKNGIVVLRLRRAVFNKVIRELKGSTLKEVIREITRTAESQE